MLRLSQSELLCALCGWWWINISLNRLVFLRVSVALRKKHCAHDCEVIGFTIPMCHYSLACGPLKRHLPNPHSPPPFASRRTRLLCVRRGIFPLTFAVHVLFSYVSPPGLTWRVLWRRSGATRCTAWWGGLVRCRFSSHRPMNNDML